MNGPYQCRITGQLFKELDRHHPLQTREYEAELARTYKESITLEDGTVLKDLSFGDIAARNELIAPHLRFVKKRAHYYALATGLHSRVNDMVGEGGIGLIKAANKFDPERGYRFISYAVWWINAYIMNFTMKHGRVVKTGTTQLQRAIIGKLDRIGKALFLADAGQPDRTGLEKILRSLEKSHNCTEEQLRSAYDYFAATDVSLNNILGENGGRTTHLDMLPEEGEGDTPTVVEARSDRAFAKKMVHDAAEYALGLHDYGSRAHKVRSVVLSERLLAHYKDRITLREIGERFEMSRERARQIEADVLKRLAIYVRHKSSGEDKLIIDLFLKKMDNARR